MELYTTRNCITAFQGKITKIVQGDNTVFFISVSSSPSLIYHVHKGNVYISGVVADGNAGSVSSHLISDPESAYAKLNMKLRGLSPSRMQANVIAQC